MNPALTKTLRLLGLLEAGRRAELKYRKRQPRALPDAVIIGGQKCGTSSLHNYLTQAPGVIAPLRKEVHYFDLHYDKGEDWYRAHFGRMGEPGLNIDASPYYIFHPLVADRMQSLLPGARLIVLLRDPVKRAYSHYWHERDKRRESLSFEAALAAESGRIDEAGKQLAAGEIARSEEHRLHSYLARGRYADQLERWLALYPPRQFHFILFESFVKRPLETLNAALGFLDLPPVASARLEPRNTRRYPSMQPETAQRLQKYFAPHNARLEQLLDLSLNWN